MDASQDRCCLLGAQTLGKLAFSEETQGGVQPAHHTCAASDQIVMPFRQQPQHRCMVLDSDIVKVAFAQRDDRHRTGVVTVRLVGLLVVQQANTRGQLRWHIDHPFTGSDQLLCQQRTGAGRALDRPHPRRELGRPAQQPLPLSTIRRQLEHRQHCFAAVDHDRRMRPPMRVDPDDEHGSS